MWDTISSIIDGNLASTGSANDIYRTPSLSKGTFTVLFWEDTEKFL